MRRITESDIYYNGIPKIVADLLTSLMLWENDACQLVINPSTYSITVALANAGAVIPVNLGIYSTESTPTLISFADFTLAAAITETISDATIIPTVSDTTPNLESGEVVVNVTLPAPGESKTYVAEETITLTISNYTAQDGRTVSGGTCVITIV